MKIGILSSGGDCGGLNAAIKGAARMAHHHGFTPFLITNGYAGLYNLIDTERLVNLTEERLEAFPVYLAGSEAGNSRVKVSKIIDENKYGRIKAGLEKHGLKALIIAGGDDTGSVVVDLGNQGISCIHVPKTMDLDLMPYSVGGDSTINRIADAIRDLHTTSRTHNRVLVLEVFGRYAGHTAFRGGVAGEADAVLIPEIPVDFDVLYRHVRERYIRRLKASDNQKASVSIVVAEGLRDSSGKELVDESSEPDAFGHRKLMGAGKYVVKQIETRMKADEGIKQVFKENGLFVEGIYEIPEVRDVRPGHLMRCGMTSAYDVNFGLEAGAAAVELARRGIFGVTAIGLQNGVVQYMEVKEAIVQRHVSEEDVRVFEATGISFGREPQKIESQVEKVSGRPVRPY